MNAYGLAVAALPSAAITFAATPLVAWLARRGGIVDHPGGRRVHNSPVPRLGGIAVLMGLLGAAATYALSSPHSDLGATFLRAEFLSFFAPISMAFLIGIVDDVRGIGPGPRIAVESTAAVWLIQSGYVIDRIATPWGLPLELGAVSYPLTLIWFVGVTNAFNLVDGLDGLLSSIAICALLGAGAVAVLGGRQGSAILSFALAGALIGFLPWNWHPGRIFLGDSGSLLIGMATAALSLRVARNPGPTGSLAFHVPVLLCLVPITETLFTLARRYISGQAYFTGDRSHIHHVLLNKGLSVQRAVATLAAVAALCCVMAVLSRAWRTSGVLSVILAAGCLALLALRWLGYAEFAVLLHRVRGVFRARRPGLPAALALARLSANIRGSKSLAQLIQVLEAGAPSVPGIRFLCITLLNEEQIPRPREPEPHSLTPSQSAVSRGHTLLSLSPTQAINLDGDLNAAVEWQFPLPTNGLPTALLILRQAFPTSAHGLRAEDVLNFLVQPLGDTLPRLLANQNATSPNEDYQKSSR